MADRAGIAEIRAFATLIIQSEKLGSSIAQTLRIYAGEMRERRKLRAEEKAHRLPVLLSVPLVACMLPTMIGVLMLPAVIRVIRVMLPAMGGYIQGEGSPMLIKAVLLAAVTVAGCSSAQMPSNVRGGGQSHAEKL